MNDWDDDKGWPAPCKINLFLHITGRRADGYHELQTIFQLLDWGDTLYFSTDNSGEICRLNDLAGVPAEQDLVVKAAQKLRQRYGHPQLGVATQVRKRIPQGGGLGGGSSDAATTLLALNKLWGIGASIDQIAQLGLELGADVPVFVRGRSSWGEGIGEKLTPLELPQKWFLIAKPQCEVSTATIFQDSGLTRGTSHKRITPSYGAFHNDCEAVVRRLFPKIDLMLEALSQFGQSRLTGTGACAFVAFDNKEAAQQAQESLSTDYFCVVARGTNFSALHRKKCIRE